MIPDSGRERDVGCNRLLDHHVPHAANQLVQLARIATCLAIILPAQLEKGESVLVGTKGATDRLVQINETICMTANGR
jgi:predicted LPLAT superfamily acyltransferase